jgi:diguanylate cyclase (GGDEF)-like protein
MPHRKPELAITSRLLIKAASATERWRPATQWAVALTSLALVCAADFVTGTQASLMFLYLLVAGLAAWSVGEREGLLFGLLVAVGGATVHHLQHILHPEHAVPVTTELWNLFARIVTTGLVVILVSGMHGALRLERWRASTDGLTGVLNKASFHRQMAKRLAAARDTDRGFILCYMDLDGFKQVNDRHGHSAGDDVLRIFANAAVDAIRADDLFARIGGDEFVALLSIPSTDDGDHVASLVHRRISTILGRTGLPVSCSMGALVATADELDPLEAAIQFADSLMYEVKRSGKAALRVGRVDPERSLIAPDCLEIETGMAATRGTNPDYRVMESDRRAA